MNTAPKFDFTGYASCVQCGHVMLPIDYDRMHACYECKTRIYSNPKHKTLAQAIDEMQGTGKLR